MCRCLFSFFITVSFTMSRGNGLLNSDGQLLLGFKAAVQVDPLGMLSNWYSSDQDPCNWNGVQCSSPNEGAVVVTLSLPRAQLQGSLAAELGGLLHLRHLNLHHNQFHGSIPPLLFNAIQLQSLFIFSNNLSGPLPAQIGQILGLQNLDLSRNALAGSIPDSLANCTRLTSLSLDHNFFSGPIPATMGTSLQSLKKLDLSYNSLSETIPQSLGELRSLVDILNLSHNQLSGAIPASLAKLPANFTLDVSNNNLSGAIPRDGALANQGQTAFLGNAGLCGIPLSTSCSCPSPVLSPPSSTALTTTKRSKGLSKGAIAAIAIGDAAGVALVCLVFLYCYWRKFARKKSSKASSTPSPEAGGPNSSGRASWLCHKNSTTESPEALEQGELVALDDEVSFNLDELLKASAYVLGKSGVGIVYKVNLSDELTVAVRRLGDASAHKFKEFQAEVEAIGRIRHPNIVSLRAYYWADDEKLLVYDFIPNGSIGSALNGQSLAGSEPLLWSSRLKIARGTARGLAFLHEQDPSRKCAHGDIKPSNILLDLEMEPYVGDYGLNRLLSIVGSGVPNPAGKVSVSSRSSGSTISGGPPISPDDLHYQPPEAALSKSFRPTQKGDVYSFGMVLLELLTGKPHVRSPSSEVDLPQWIEAALEGKKPLLRIVDPVLVDEMHRADDMLSVLKIAMACVAPQPDQRPQMRQVSDRLDQIGTA